MVQHQTDGFFKHDDYWKLEMQPPLQPARYRGDPTGLDDYTEYGPRTLDQTRAQDLFSRKECGLLAYELCTPAELMRFLEQRQVVEPGDKILESRSARRQKQTRGKSSLEKQEKRELVALLEKADDEQKFDRFPDLPAELRAVVYDLHFAWLMKKNSGSLTSPTPPPPPITQVCTQLRQETMQPFYQSCVIRIYFGLYRERTSNRYKICERSFDFFQKAPQSHVEMVRHIKILCRYFERSSGFYLAKFVVDLGTQMILPSVKVVRKKNPATFESQWIPRFENFIINEWMVTLKGGATGATKLTDAEFDIISLSTAAQNLLTSVLHE